MGTSINDVRSTPISASSLMFRWLFNEYGFLSQDKTFELYDPCAGSGALFISSRQVSRYSEKIAYFASEIRQEEYPILAALCGSDNVRIENSLNASWKTYDIIVTSPPCKDAHKFLLKFKERATVSVFLVKLSLLSSDPDGMSFFMHNTPSAILFPREKIPFYSKRTNIEDYCWVVFDGESNSSSIVWL